MTQNVVLGVNTSAAASTPVYFSLSPATGNLRDIPLRRLGPGAGTTWRHLAPAWSGPWRRELGGCRHEGGGRVCDPLAVPNPLDVGAGVNQRPAHLVDPADHPHPVAEPQRLPEPHLQAARQARVPGMP